MSSVFLAFKALTYGVTQRQADGELGSPARGAVDADLAVLSDDVVTGFIDADAHAGIAFRGIEGLEQANDWDRSQNKQLKAIRKADEKRIKELERELKRKEKALAGTAALLVLRKKAQAIWGDGEEE